MNRAKANERVGTSNHPPLMVCCSRIRRMSVYTRPQQSLSCAIAAAWNYSEIGVDMMSDSKQPPQTSKKKPEQTNKQKPTQDHK